MMIRKKRLSLPIQLWRPIAHQLEPHALARLFTTNSVLYQHVDLLPHFDINADRMDTDRGHNPVRLLGILHLLQKSPEKLTKELNNPTQETFDIHEDFVSQLQAFIRQTGALTQDIQRHLAFLRLDLPQFIHRLEGGDHPPLTSAFCKARIGLELSRYTQEDEGPRALHRSPLNSNRHDIIAMFKLRCSISLTIWTHLELARENFYFALQMAVLNEAGIQAIGAHLEQNPLLISPHEFDSPLHALLRGYQTRVHVREVDSFLGILQLLIRSGADVDAINLEGNTPLHLAVQHRAVGAVSLLLESGCDTQAHNHQGELPRDLAKHMPEILDLLPVPETGQPRGGNCCTVQ